MTDGSVDRAGYNLRIQGGNHSPYAQFMHIAWDTRSCHCEQIIMWSNLRRSCEG